MTELVWDGIVIGFGATVLMDAWAFLLHFAFGQPRPNWAMPGRWFWHLGKGKVFHDSIANAPAVGFEHPLGWIGHYVVGIIYGVVLVLFMGPGWLAAPTFLPAFIWGIVTIAAGWFLMQPGMGLGWAASRLPNPPLVRAMGLIAHTVFAIGLYGTALLIR